MARKIRLHVAGAFYHVMLRGNDGQIIFYSDQDRCKLCLLLQEAKQRFHFKVHGFCFMSNHIHLVLQTSETSVSTIIQNIAFRYTRYVNYKEKRVGHLFQGRFKSILVEDGGYLLKLIKYVHMNPVRAKITPNPENYVWSSHRAYLGIATCAWLTTDHVFGKFDASPSVAMACYKKYMDNEPLSEIDFEQCREGNTGVGILGSDSFSGEILKANQTIHLEKYTLDQLIEVVCKVMNRPVSVISNSGKGREGSQARSLVAYFIKQTPHLTLKDFAEKVGRDISSLSKPVREIELRLQNDETLQMILNKIKEELNGSGLVDS